MHEDVHEWENNAASLLAIAVHHLKEGRVLHGWAIAKGLAKQNFFRKMDARVLEALASTRLLPNSSYQESRKKFRVILDTEDFREPTIPRANVLVGLAWTNIAMGDFDQATEPLEEAARIYTAQGAKELGYVISLQGLVDIWHGDLAGALKNFKKGKTYSQIDISGAMKTNFDFFESQFDQATEGIDEASLVAVAGIS